MIRFYLDGIEVVNPKGWENLKSVIKRDQDTDGIIIYQDQDVDFTGDGYDYIISTANNSGFCSQISCEVTREKNGVTKLLLKGNIFISDCIFNERTKSVTAKIKDSSYFAMVEYNKSIKTVVTSGKSKNGVDITPCPKFSLQVWGVDDTALIKTVFAVRIYDAFMYLIRFMSDGLIGFESDTFKYGGEWDHLVITSGDKLRGTNVAQYGTAPIAAFSFIELLQEVKKRIPIGFIVESPYSNPVIRVESLSYFTDTSKSDVSFELIDEIKTRFDQNRLYSSLNLGSSVTLDTAFVNFPENIKWFGFNDETFIIQTKCNIDNTLALVGDWVVSSNVIQNCVNELDSSYDENIFLIDTVLSEEYVGRTTNTNFLQLNAVVDPNVYFYNEALTNQEVAKRYIGLVPSSIAGYFEPNGTGNFTAALSANYTITAMSPQFVVPFDLESLDNGGNYDTTTFQYTAYTAGVFDFNYLIDVELEYRTNPSIRRGGYVWFMVYDPDGNLRLQTARQRTSKGWNTNPQGPIEYTTRIVMNEGEYVEMWFGTEPDTSPLTPIIKITSFWRCVANTGTGGVFQDYDPADYPAYIHEFNVPLSSDDFDTLKANPTQLIRFYSDPQYQRYAWISELSYTHSTGLAQVKLITSQSVNNGN